MIERWSEFDLIGWEDTVAELKGLHPKVADAVSQLLNEAKARGLSVGLFCGLRTVDQQNALFAKGRTVENPDGKSDEKPMGNIVTRARWGQSWHNYGLAVDVVFKDAKGRWTWNKTEEEWGDLGRVGEMFGMEWGGRWTMKDYPHFQMRGAVQGVDHAKQILDTEGMDALWKLV